MKVGSEFLIGTVFLKFINLVIVKVFMHKYSEKGRSLETETSSVLLEFEDTTFYARVSRAKCCIVTICSVVTMILASVSYHLLTSDVALV